MTTRCDTERNRTQATEREAREHQAIMPRFAAQGVTALYGGGRKSKGHGFWLQRNGVTVKNDGAASGNPSFWMYEEALALLKGSPAAELSAPPYEIVESEYSDFYAEFNEDAKYHGVAF